MSIKDYTEEDLAMLTDEEREGLLSADEDEEEGDDEGQDDTTGGDNDDGDDDSDGGDDDAKGGTKQPEGDDQDNGGEGDDQNNDKADEDDEGEDDKVEPPPQPLFKADLPADIEAKRQDLDTKEDDLIKKFDEGDITFAEYNKELRSINRERSALDRAELKAELAQEAAQSQSEQTWQSTAQSFVADHPLISKNETMWNSFDIVLRRITAETMEKGGQPGRRELEKAYKQWTADLGIQDSADTKTDTTPQPKSKKQNVVPPTLGKVPAATATDTDDGKFGYLDRLAESDPIAYEETLLKMSDAEREAYLAS